MICTLTHRDLVDLASLDKSIWIDLRYAGTNNVFRRRVYALPVAFLQRPVADALIAAHHQLREIGLGIVVYDAYRPLSVTRLFWEWTPEDKRGFVADPDVGSIHNRGCAVDVGLFSVSTHQPLAMPSDYDEMSERSFPTYAGGTSEQRLHRDLLRKTMEEQRFTVHQREWWHFDHFLWPSYDVLDVPFEQISS